MRAKKKCQDCLPFTSDTALSRLDVVTLSTDEFNLKWPLSVSLTKNILVSLSLMLLWHIRASPNPSTIIVLSAKLEFPLITRLTFTTLLYVSDRERYNFSTVPVNTMSTLWCILSLQLSDRRRLAEHIAGNMNKIMKILISFILISSANSVF